MSYEKQRWQTYDELKAEGENMALGAVVTSERMNHIEDGIESSHKKIGNHLQRFNNPHMVTSEQVGAYSKEEANKKFEKIGSSYTKNESKDLFIKQTEVENGLFVRKNSKILDLNDAKDPGIYSIPATGVKNKPLPNSGSLIVNKDPGGARQLFQTERTVLIRQFGGNPSKWTDWKEVAFKKNTYIYKKSGLNEVEGAYKTAFGKESNILLIREGDKVEAYLRVNVADVTKLKTAMVPIFVIPEGFKIDESLRSDFWNVALTTVQYTFPQGNYGALYEYDVKSIRFGSDRKGNHYVHGSWRTVDPFPKSGSLGTGTVTTLD